MQTTFLSIKQGSITQKETKRLRFNFEEILYALLGFFMGQAEVFSGLYPFSIIYWSVFIGRGSLPLLLVTLSTCLGFVLNGMYYKLYYLIAGFSGFLIYKVVGKYVKQIPLHTTISLVYLMMASIINYYYQVLPYKYLLSVGESVLIFLFINFFNDDSFSFLSNKKEYNKISFIFMFFVSNGIIIGISNINFVPSYVINISILLIIVGMAYSLGFYYSVVTAVLYGITMVSAGLIPIITMVRYIIFGLVTGLLHKKQKLWMVPGIIISFLLYSGFSPAIFDIRQVIIESIITVLIFLFIPGFVWEESFANLKVKGNERNNKELKISFIENTFKQHLLELGKVFNELSSTFKDSIPDEKKDDSIDDFIYILRKKNCQRCPRVNICWNKERSDTIERVRRLINAGEKRGNINKTLVIEFFGGKCPYVDKVNGNFKNSFELYQINKFWKKRLAEKQKIVSEQLSGIGSIIKGFSSSAKLTLKDNPSLEHIKEKARRAGIEIYDIEENTSLNIPMVNLKVKMEPCTGNEPCKDVFLPLLESEFGYSFRILKGECGSKLKDRPCEILYGPRGRFELDMTVIQRPLSGNIPGDSYLYKPLKDGKDLIALSDGMGVGKKAARESKAALKLLDKIIDAGFDQNLAIKTINSALYLRNQEESFTTLDIGFFDTFTGEITFNKIGAAASFVKKGWHVEVIKSASLPVGILNKIEITSQKVQLSDGDFVIIVSDGVLDIKANIKDKEAWFKQVLQNSSFDKVEDLGEYLNEIIEEQEKLIRDDLTLIVIKAKEISKKSRIL